MSGEDFRLSYVECRQVLTKRLAEPAPARIQLLAGRHSALDYRSPVNYERSQPTLN